MHSSERSAKVFTVEQANAMLPLIRAITLDLTALAHDVMERRERLSAFAKRGALNKQKGRDPYADELDQMQQTLASDSQRLHEFIDELRELGVEPKGALDGLVDFPAILDGRHVYLCWRLGESEVTHWHDLDAGFAGRQSLVAGVSAGDDDLTFDDLNNSDEHS
jgi:hypothetical protein